MGKQESVYVCGPMTNHPHFNFPAFHDAAEDLRRRGYKVISPAELDSPEAKRAAEESLDGDPSHYANNESWGDLLARDVKLLADDGIETIACLPGWEKSRGGKLETFVGRLCGLLICNYNGPGQMLTPASDRELHEAHGTLDVADLISHKARTPDIVGDVAVEMVTGEVRQTDPETGGQKGVKPERYDLLPWDQLAKVARLYARGAAKYEAHNWRRGYVWSSSFASLIRHATAFWEGESLDPETECHHLASVVFHALALMFFEEEHPQKDDRWIQPQPERDD